MSDINDILQKEFRVAQVIWIAILAALMIYVVIGHFLIGREFVDPETTPVQLIRNILAGVGGLMLIGSFFIRRKMLAGGIGPQPLSEAEAAAKYKTATIIAAGICEAVGLFGLVLIFLGDNLWSLYLFNIVAAAALMLHRPKMEELVELAGGSGMSL